MREKQGMECKGHQNFPKNLKCLDQTFSDVSRRFQIVQISSLQTFADLVQTFVTYLSNTSDAPSSQLQILPKLSRTSALHTTAIIHPSFGEHLPDWASGA